MNPSRLVMIGDSITEWGRPAPGSPDYATALGHGYVSLVAAWLRAERATRPLDVLNRGVGGNTIRDLAQRWDRDVLAHRPDLVSVMIGINDVWRYFDPERQADAVPPAEFEATYDALLARTRPTVQRLFLLTPFYVQPDRNDPMRRRVDEFGAIVARLAARHEAVIIDTQAEIDVLLRLHSPEAVAHDRVHIGPLGHEALARAFLATLAW